MAYTKAAMKSSIKYVKEHQKQIIIKYKNDEYTQHIQPAIEKSGLPTATFIKRKKKKKIERDGLLENEHL